MIHPERRSPVRVRPRDALALAFFTALWLVPIAWTGLTYGPFPGMPRTLEYLQTIAYLFVPAKPTWPAYYIQAIPEGSESWVTVPEERFFRLKPFGYRTRLSQVLARTHYADRYERGQKRERARHAELAEWVARRSAAEDGRELRSVRFVVGFVHAGDPGMTRGRWRTPPLADLPPERVHVLSTHDFEDGRRVRSRSDVLYE
jgi:hypothetical protein